MWQMYCDDLDNTMEVKENLFLESCSFVVVRVMCKIRFCEACQKGWPGQDTHSCQYPELFPHTDNELMRQSLPYLLQQEERLEVFREMESLLRNKKEYSEITTSDLLSFLAPYFDFEPFTKLCSNPDWQERLYKMITTDEATPTTSLAEGEEEEAPDSL